MHNYNVWTIESCHYSNANLPSELKGSYVDCVFRNAYFSASTTISAGFKRCVFDNCRFKDSRFSRGFESCVFNNCFFENCDFWTTSFNDCKLLSCKLNLCRGLSQAKFKKDCVFDYVKGIKIDFYGGEYYTVSSGEHRTNIYGTNGSAYKPLQKEMRLPPKLLPEVKHYRSPQPKVQFTERRTYVNYYHKEENKAPIFDCEYGKDYGYGRGAVLECANIEVLRKCLG